MTEDQIASTARYEFNEFVLANAPDMPVQYDNQNKPEPDSGIFARPTVLFGDSAQIAFGSVETFESTGMLKVQLFDEIGKGDGQLLELAAAIKLKFRNLKSNGVKFLTPSIKTVGRTNTWWQVNVDCPFQATDN